MLGNQSGNPMGQQGSEKAIDQLNSFLRGEISAVETYRQALEKLTGADGVRTSLQQCMTAHQRRVDVLRQRIQQLGGKPADSSGPWGAFARLLQGGANVFGEKTAIAALEEGEDRCIKDYRADLSKLDPESRRLVEQQLLPGQEQTHRVVSNLKQGTQARA